MEQWLDIPGYEGRYQVSDQGRVKSLARCYKIGKSDYCRPEVIMSQGIWIQYFVVWLHKPGIAKKKFKVHRLVAMAFLPNPQNKEFVNHIDRNRANNCLPNLEWVTPQENSDHWVADDKAKSDIPF